MMNCGALPALNRIKNVRPSLFFSVNKLVNKSDGDGRGFCEQKQPRHGGNPSSETLTPLYRTVTQRALSKSPLAIMLSLRTSSPR
jgi:hypothetical protein